ncbi:hypothetical protein BS47DRAFT_1368034 [Hydnum rufescens UP504]|uniref:Uncharacterized protein n=1 Tax=Hydnum rufescens UP504 TaxID=1448309 RepID=A0A9P6DNP9_9AGAM|nr:hypothetical protein BS47DRAFT_1368034 [Hydnum rufescens UP504]
MTMGNWCGPMLMADTTCAHSLQKDLTTDKYGTTHPLQQVCGNIWTPPYAKTHPTRLQIRSHMIIPAHKAAPDPVQGFSPKTPTEYMTMDKVHYHTCCGGCGNTRRAGAALLVLPQITPTPDEIPPNENIDEPQHRTWMYAATEDHAQRQCGILSPCDMWGLEQGMRQIPNGKTDGEHQEKLMSTVLRLTEALKKGMRQILSASEKPLIQGKKGAKHQEKLTSTTIGLTEALKKKAGVDLRHQSETNLYFGKLQQPTIIIYLKGNSSAIVQRTPYVPWWYPLDPLITTGDGSGVELHNMENVLCAMMREKEVGEKRLQEMEEALHMMTKAKDALEAKLNHFLADLSFLVQHMSNVGNIE